MVGFICFFIEEHLYGRGYGAPFVVKTTPKCQDIFLNNFLTEKDQQKVTKRVFMLVPLLERRELWSAAVLRRF
jgi:hypothetical protein